VQALLKRQVEKRVRGPSEKTRGKTGCVVWGEATDADGRVLRRRLRTPNGYELTVTASLGIVQRLLDSERLYSQIDGAIAEDYGRIGQLQRQVLELRLQGFHLEEIAVQTRRSVRTVSRLLDQVRELLEAKENAFRQGEERQG